VSLGVVDVFRVLMSVDCGLIEVAVIHFKHVTNSDTENVETLVYFNMFYFIVQQDNQPQSQ
jgi:hypothetical protein